MIARPALFVAALSLAAQALDPAKLVDLSYPYDAKTIYWPNAKGFVHRKDAWQRTPLGYWYAAGGFATDEHGGTHIDSPIHFAEGKLTLEAIPVRKLAGPAFVIDISAAASRNRDYTATPADVAAFEKRYGRIPAGAIVVFRTGWGKFWPDKEKYLGSAVPGDVANLRFPGISEAAASVLVRRGIVGVGIDTASTDPGTSRRFETHQVLSEANIYGLENIANADKLPPTGATLIVAPMKITNGTGGPARILALLP